MIDSRVRVRTGSRLHFGFRNLATSRDRLFGGIGAALEEPGTVLTVEPANDVHCPHPRGREIAERVVSHLDVGGAHVAIEAELPRHVGLGSGTQLALAIGVGIAQVHGRDLSIRGLAATLDRGRRSGVGVACFENGGFVLDAGQPTDVVTGDETASRSVPRLVEREPLPDTWRFLLVRPDTDRGRSGTCESETFERIIRSADPALASRIEDAIASLVLPGIRDRDVTRFGRGITGIDALTGEWFAPEQGRRHRAPCDRLIEHLAGAPSIAGWGQSSWGPTAYGVTTADRAADARRAGDRALDGAGLAGSVRLVGPRNRGAVVDELSGSNEPTAPNAAENQ